MYSLPTSDVAPPKGHVPAMLAPQAVENGLQVRVANSPAEWNATLTQQAWKRLLATSDNPNAMHQSPEWIAHLARAPKTRERLRVLTVHEPSDGIVAVVPMLSEYLRLDVSARGKTAIRNRLPVDQLLGYEPLSNNAAPVVNYLAQLCVHSERPIHIRMLRTDSAFHKQLANVSASTSNSRLFHFSAPSYRHLINLGSDFRGYLSKFSTKKRYNLKRQVQQLAEASGSSLKLVEFTKPDDVESFLRDAGPVAGTSWQNRVSEDVISNSDRWLEELLAIARQGMLRCFVLYANGQACAFVLGIQYADTFHFDATGYDPRFHSLSPGTAILYLLIEELIGNPKGVQRISLGFGDQEYKRVFGNERLSNVEVLLYRPSMVIAARVALYRTYRAGVELARRIKAGNRK